MADALYGDRLFNTLERNEPAPGMLLVAAPGMQAGLFTRSVVLVLERNVDGVAGVILNRRSDIPVAEALPAWLDYVAKPHAFYVGGPVMPEAAISVGMTTLGVKIEQHPSLQRLANRLAQVDLRADPAAFEGVLEGIRLFGGYSAWDPGQLEEEINHGDWFVAPALPGDVLCPASTDLWGDVMRRQAMPLPLYSTFPAELGGH